MPILDLKSAYKNYYSDKSIQRNYNFYLTIENNDNVFGKWNTKYPDNPLDAMPEIELYHVRNVSLPSNIFNKEALQYGVAPKTFLTYNSPQGLDLRMELEEDDKGTIRKLIQWGEERRMSHNGYHRNPDLVKIDRITVNVLDNENNLAIIYRFKAVDFLSADPIAYDYTASDSIKYILTFTVDMFDVEFKK